MRGGISTIYQDVRVIESLSVADNIFLGCEKGSRVPGVIDARAQIAQAGRAILTRPHCELGGCATFLHILLRSYA